MSKRVTSNDVKAAVTAARYGRLFLSADDVIKIRQKLRAGDFIAWNRDAWGRAALQAGFVELQPDGTFRATAAGLRAFGLPEYREAADA